MLLPRDVVVSLAPGARLQVVATPGAPWITTTSPVLARNLVEELLVAAGGAYQSPRGLYVRLVSDAAGVDAGMPAGAEVYVDPSSSLDLVGKQTTDNRRLAAQNTGVAIGFGLGLLVATIAATALR